VLGGPKDSVERAGVQGHRRALAQLGLVGIDEIDPSDLGHQATLG
jgi:hypothetical protein